MKRANYTLMVVEDDDLDIEKLKRSYRKMGVEVDMICVEDGERALEVLRDTTRQHALQRPPILLLDINLPKLNGLELLERIRCNELIATTPVFVISTSNRHEDINQAYRHGAAGYFTKPMTMVETYGLVEILHNYWSASLPPTLIASDAQTYRSLG